MAIEATLQDITQRLDRIESALAAERPLLLKKQQAGECLGVSSATIERLERDGLLTRVDFYQGAVRFRRSDVEALAEGGSHVDR